jgi:hypothetical protein
MKNALVLIDLRVDSRGACNSEITATHEVPPGHPRNSIRPDSGRVAIRMQFPSSCKFDLR